jgi:hypothetical protein
MTNQYLHILIKSKRFVRNTKTFPYHFHTMFSFDVAEVWLWWDNVSTHTQVIYLNLPQQRCEYRTNGEQCIMSVSRMFFAWTEVFFSSSDRPSRRSPINQRTEGKPGTPAPLLRCNRLCRYPRDDQRPSVPFVSVWATFWMCTIWVVWSQTRRADDLDERRYTCAGDGLQVEVLQLPEVGERVKNTVQHVYMCTS